jgi:hypothetical protein
MSNIETDDISVAKSAYAIAWKSFRTFARLSRDEKESAPKKLREYIDVLVNSGERDAEKVAQSALGLIREHEQIARSFARLLSTQGIAL